MAFEFFLPDIGEGLTEAVIVRWLVDVGDQVGVDEPLVEVETDKAVVEIPAPRPGVLLHQGAAAGSTMSVGDLLVVIGDAGEEWAPPPDGGPADVAPIVGTLEEARDGLPDSGVVERPAAGGSRREALPLVRRLASDLGVEIEGMWGSGPGGRVTREDVEAAAQGSGPAERVRMSPTRLAIARNLSRSWQEIPHVTTYGDADAAGIFAERTRLREEIEKPVPLEAILMDAIVPLLDSHRGFNAAVDGDDIIYREARDVGFAVDTPRGLLVAVVRDADTRDLVGTAEEIVRLAAAAKKGRITPAEMRGATFTISNIGAVGGGFGTPIIPHGTSAILSVGQAEERPVVSDGAVTVGRRLPLSLSYDHRIVDGAQGRAFMADVIAALEARV